MMNSWLQKNKYIVGGVAILILIVAGIFFFLQTKKDTKNGEEVPNTDSESIVTKEGDAANSADTTSGTELKTGQSTSPKTYPPLSNISVTLSPESKTILENRKKTEEAAIAGFTDTTPVDIRVGYYIALAADERALGNYKTAEEWFLKAISVDPKNPYIHQAYSALLWVASEKDHALSEINTALRLKGNEFNFWLSKIMYSSALKPEAIEQIYQNALTSTGNDINIVTSFAVFEETTGDIQDAIALWKKAQTILPERSGLYQSEIDRLSKK